MAFIEIFKEWAETIRQDVDALRAVLDAPGADEHSRKLAGGALQYLVSRMDLIPDWNEGIGVIDDLMVLRLCAALTTGHDRGALPAAAEVALGRMANEADQIQAFLGGGLADKLKAHCARLADAAVRGRTPAQLLAEPALRAALAAEIDEELRTSVPVVIADPADAELRLRAYLTHKLG